MAGCNRLEGALPADRALHVVPIRAVSIGAVLPRVFLGDNRVTTIASGATALRPSVLDRPTVNDAFTSIYHDDARLGATFKEYVAARRDVVMALDQADGEMHDANNGAPPSYAFAGDAIPTCSADAPRSKSAAWFPRGQRLGHPRQSGRRQGTARQVS